VRYVLDRDGERLDADRAAAGAAIAFGPEGGLEPSELAEFRERGWRPTVLASTTLRFETAGVAAVAILRAAAVVAKPEV
jgi:RsmE family RNA methyltransferase